MRANERRRPDAPSRPESGAAASRLNEDLELDRFMLALSIRQPFAELILRGIKTVEYRSRPTKRVGERFWIYAAKRPAAEHRRWSQVAGGLFDPIDAPPPPWLAELNNASLEQPRLPMGLIVGSAVIERCCPFVPMSDVSRQSSSKPDCTAPLFLWHLTQVQRLPAPRKPEGRPQPVWFRPF